MEGNRKLTTFGKVILDSKEGKSEKAQNKQVYIEQDNYFHSLSSLLAGPRRFTNSRDIKYLNLYKNHYCQQGNVLERTTVT